MRLSVCFCLLLMLAACGGGFVEQAATQLEPVPAGQFQNPLRISVPDGSYAESCPDPSVIRGQSPGDEYWYLYCTSERFKDHAPVHLLPISRSKDLVNWTYVGDVFDSMPSWMASDGGLWAPDIQYFNGKYYLYYSAWNTRAGGSAIYVATSDTPTGPWTAYTLPVVEPSLSECCRGGYRWTIDSYIVQDGERRYIFFGSFNGGLSARVLSPDGLSSSKATEVQISLPDRYEASYVTKRDGYYYLFVSAGDCCLGALSGYQVFAGRSLSPLGPYLDKDGDSLLNVRIGGTPVLTTNGNRWVGPGHNAVITDAAGQDWMIYHAIDVDKPYFKGSWTRRPVLMDPIDWVDGWPRVRGGAGPSHSLQPAPTTDPTAPNQRTVSVRGPEIPGEMRADLSDEFTGSALSAQWTWLRRPDASSYDIRDGAFRFASQTGSLYVDRYDGSVLLQPQPAGEYMVEVKVRTDVPLTGRHNFVQSGIVVFKDDNNYVKLVNVAINSTRQIEFGKQAGTKPPGSSQYGSTYVTSPKDETYLRIVKRINAAGEELYTAYSSRDGKEWERGGTWTHTLGPAARIGLVSMGGAGFNAYFEYVRVFELSK